MRVCQFYRRIVWNCLAFRQESGKQGSIADMECILTQKESRFRQSNLNLPTLFSYAGRYIKPHHKTMPKLCLPYARSTLLERRHLVQAYTWQGVPFTMAFTRFTLGFHSRLERLWEWETLIPKVTPLPQKSHFAIHCTSHPDSNFETAPIQALVYTSRFFCKKQVFF